MFNQDSHFEKPILAKIPNPHIGYQNRRSAILAVCSEAYRDLYGGPGKQNYPLSVINMSPF
jgi:hypothetical protein